MINMGNDEWIEDLNVRPETIKLLEENTVNSDIPRSNIFLLYPRARGTKEKIDKWNYTELKSFCTAKEIINQIKTQPTKWEKKFAHDTSNKRLLPKIYKGITHPNTKKTM